MSKNKIIIYSYSISLNGTLVIMNYELFYTLYGIKTKLFIIFAPYRV